MPYVYTRPMPFTDGDVLGASNINMIVRNQRWLREVTEPLAQPVVREYKKANGDTGSHVFYVRHGGISNALRVRMSVWMEQAGTLSLYYKQMTGTPLAQYNVPANQTQEIDSTLDISNYPPNAHPVAGEVVKVKMEVSTPEDWSVTVHRLGEVLFSSDIQYQKASGNFADNTVARARYLNWLVQNDVELGALVSPSPGFRATDVSRYGQEVKFTIRHGGDSDKLRIVFTYGNDTGATAPEQDRSHIKFLYNGQVVLVVPDDIITSGNPHRFIDPPRWFDKVVDLPANHPDIGTWVTIRVQKTPSDPSGGNPYVRLYYIGEERYL